MFKESIHKFASENQIISVNKKDLIFRHEIQPFFFLASLKDQWHSVYVNVFNLFPLRHGYDAKNRIRFLELPFGGIFFIPL